MKSFNIKITFTYLFLFSILLILFNRSYGQTTEPVYQLIERLLPRKAAQFEIKIVPNSQGKEYFEMESQKGKIIINGTNNLSITKELGYYLNNYCGVRVSCYAVNSISIPDVLPMVPEKVVQECRFEKRFFLNYCTFGYTMLSWQWEDKENIPLDMAQSDRDMASFEWAWTNQNIEYINTPQGDPVKIVREIYAKYSPFFKICND